MFEGNTTAMAPICDCIVIIVYAFFSILCLFFFYRYVHSMGCVEVKLTEEQNDKNVGNILMTSYCSICQESTPGNRMSRETW